MPSRKSSGNITACLLILLSNLVFVLSIRGQQVFTDITSEAGVRESDRGGHGVAVGDVNNDGLLDIYVTNSYLDDPLGNHLFINRGGNVFDEISEQVGVDDRENIGGHGVVLADIDRDQDLDIYIGNMGERMGDTARNTLYRNDGGLVFRDISLSSGIGHHYTATRGVAALDVDMDGDLDLISSPFDDLINMFINDGTGRFVKEYRGIGDDTLPKQGISVVDIEGDGDVDLYVNKWGHSPNRLFLNDGHGFFEERAELLGIDSFEIENNGATFDDIDNDGDLDLFVMNKTQSGAPLQVYRNDDGFFVDETEDHGIIGDGFSPVTGDVDNDGDLDIFLPRAFESFALYVNDGNGHFTEYMDSGLEVTGEDARGSSLADFDNDGDLDLIVVQKAGYSYLFRNESNSGRFIEIRLIGPGGEKYAMGTRAELYEAGHAGDRNFLKGCREISSAMAYISQFSPVIHFGLEDAAPTDILLRFPTREVVLLESVQPGEILDVDARDQVPIYFDLISPVHADTVVGPFILLDWGDSFEPDPLHSMLYDIYCGTSPVFDSSCTYVERGLSASQLELSTGLLLEAVGGSGIDARDADEPGENASDDHLMLHWKVLGYNAQGDTTYSIPFGTHFWTPEPHRPDPFSLLLPLDGDSVSAGDDILFVWEGSSDPDAYDSLLTYHVQVGLDSLLSDTVWTASTSGDTALLRAPVGEPAVFYWNVTAVGMDGLGRSSSSIFACRVVGAVGMPEEEGPSHHVPKGLILSQNFPNPFNPSTTIRFEVPRQDDGLSANVTLKIYSLRGRLVRTILDSVLKPGSYEFVWNGQDDRYAMVPSGIYLAVLEYGSETRKVKMNLRK